jgi:hypothetical protein
MKKENGIGGPDALCVSLESGKTLTVVPCGDIRFYLGEEQVFRIKPEAFSAIREWLLSWNYI